MFPDRLIAGKWVTLYGICIAIGIVACIFLLRKLGKKIGVDPKFLEFTETLGYLAIMIGFLGAALWQALYNFLENPSDGFHFSLENITFIGGLIFGVATFLVVYNIRRPKLTGRVTDILPIAPCCITIAHGFGRIGCNFAGCCYGKVVPEGKWYSWFAVNMYHTDHVFPTQLMEAAFLFILCGVMAFLVLKKKFYYTFPIYTAAYGIWRFLIEYLRDDDRGSFIPGITPSQFWAIIMIAMSVPLYFFVKYLTKKRTEELQVAAKITASAKDAKTPEEIEEEIKDE